MNDGGSAFPRTTHHRHSNGGSIHTDVDTTPGMTLRDYFAGKAMAGFIASPNTLVGADTKVIVEDAYLIADEMLRQRGEAK